MLGVAFQLVDDLLGVFGDPARTGKSATSDLRARKQTPLLAHAPLHPRVGARSAPYVGRDLTDDELAEARRLLTTCGSRGFVEELAEAHLAAARAVVDGAGPPADLLATVTSHGRAAPALADATEVAA